MAALTGFVLDPTDLDIVKVLEQCAADRKPDWLSDLNIYTEHPTQLFGNYSYLYMLKFELCLKFELLFS